MAVSAKLSSLRFAASPHLRLQELGGAAMASVTIGGKR